MFVLGWVWFRGSRYYDIIIYNIFYLSFKILYLNYMLILIIYKVYSNGLMGKDFYR